MKKTHGMTPNPDFVPRNSGNSGEPAVGPSTARRVSNGRVAAGFALAGLFVASVAVGGNHMAEQQESQREQTAAAEIAKRFDCNLVSIVDLQTPPPADTVGGSVDRTTVEVTVNVRNRAEAQPYLDEYAEDNAVAWLPPSVRARVDGSPEGLRIGGQTSHYEEGANSIQAKLYPRIGEFYPPGTTAVVAVHQEVMTSDDNSLYTTEGDMTCGTMEYDGTTWGISTALAPEAPPVELHADPWQN